MSDDDELLRRYAAEKSEAAFAELVRRHLGLVYHSALRQLHGDAHAAEDVAQTVFTDLARKAASLADRPLLAGWLHTSARYAALQRRRTERRRQQREQEAYLMQEITQTSESAVEWERLHDVIDEALHTLNPRDREAVLMRFFEGRDFAEVGARLELSPQGARSCVERALAKMQARLSRRGVRSSVAALSLALTGHAAGGAPVGLAEGVTRGAVSAAAAEVSSGAAFTLGSLTLMKVSSLVLAGSLAANVVLGFVFLKDSREAGRRQASAMPPQAAAMMALLPRKNAAPESLADPVEIGRRLRAEGFSDRVVTNAMGSAVTMQFRETIDAETAKREARMRRWNQSPRASVAVVGAPDQPKPVRWEDSPQGLRRAAVFAELGYDFTGKPFASLYRSLPAEKAVAVRKVEDDYKEIKEVGTVQVGSSGSISHAVLDQIAKDFETDIRAALSPQEASDYFRYHSETAKQVQRVLGDLKIGDEAYATIADAALDVDRLKWRRSSDPADAVRREIGLIQTYRRALGDEQLMQVFPRLTGKSYAEVDTIYQAARLSPATRADLFIAFAAAARMAGAADRAMVGARIYRSLTTGAGLTPQQVAAFDATSLGSDLKRMATSAVASPSSP